MLLAPLERVYCRPVPILIAFFLIAWLCNALSLAAADWIRRRRDRRVLGVRHRRGRARDRELDRQADPDAAHAPFVILTLGLWLFAINVAMLALAEWIAPDFSIDGFWTYIGATIVVWLVNYILHGLFGLRGEEKR